MIFENFVTTTLAAPVSIGATTISINAASAPFNTPIDPAGETVYLVLMDSINNPTKFEIVSYTGRTSTGPYTLTGLVKGLDGTDDQEWPPGTFVVNVVSAYVLNVMIKSTLTAVLTAGYTAASYDAGTKSSGTFTPDPTVRGFQHAVNGGAHDLLPPASSCTIILDYTNNASAGAITVSSYDNVGGDPFTTTNGDKHRCYISVNNGVSSIYVEALQ